MKVLVTGANGLLGQNLVWYLLKNTTHTVIATNRGTCRFELPASNNFQYHSVDITDGVAIDTFINSVKPDIIIHTAAITQPDVCEANPIACWNVNVTGTRFLVSAATNINAKFIHISTDFIFDGEAGPYKEDDIANPVNYYGSSKLAAEKLVLKSNLHWAIVRTVLVYGNILTGNRSNIITWVKENLEAKKAIKVVSDQWRTPTYIEDLVKGIILVMQKNATGVFHISGKQGMSPYDMALAVADYCNLDKNLITKVNADTFTQPAKRPLKTGFDISKAKIVLSYMPITFNESLGKMLNKA